MVLVVEDGTGLSNADSYLSIADADSYHSLYGNSSWTGDDSVKEVALRKATKYLDISYNWKGSIYSTTQSLNFPRTNIKDNQGRILDYSIPQSIKDATAELALLSLSEDLVKNTDSSNYVIREKIGDLEVEYKEGSLAVKSYNKVNRILSDLYSSSISSSSSLSLLRV